MKKGKSRIDITTTSWLWLVLLSLFAPLALAGSKVTYLHNDHLGRTVMATDASANVVWQVEYRPFGEVEIITGDPAQARFFGFPGQYFDEESGLHYNYYRYYDPSLGRYPSADPIGITYDFSSPQLQLAIKHGIPLNAGGGSPGLNHLYGYVDQNPINYIDSFGLHKGDKLFGLPKRFWQWYHRNEKRPGDPDLDRDAAEELHKDWKDRGEPGPDSKDKWPDPKDFMEFLIPPSIEAACMANPCSSFCAAWGFTCNKDEC